MSLENALVTVEVGGEQKEKFRVNMPNIRNLQGYLKGSWNLAAYDSCFPKRNRLGDIDASVEIAGHTLHVEFKESTYALTGGQLYKALNQAIYSNITTFFVFGKKDKPVGYYKFSPGNLEPPYVECTEETLKEAFKEWAKYAEANPLNTDRTALWNIVNSYIKGRGVH